jgi:hypothetical protein
VCPLTRSRWYYVRGEDVVTVRTGSWCGRMTRAATLFVITALIPLPAAASGTSTDAKTSTPTIKVSMQRLVARDVATTPAKHVVARDDRQGTTAGSAPGFFRTTPGVIALAVMAAGVGYALYSNQHDRIHSPGKQ